MPAKLKWSRTTDEQLLKLRLCDLPVRLERTPIRRRLRRLYLELKSRGIRFRPHVWISDEFFTPDGVPGFAVPFYLTHPRLIKLEKSQMLEVEGKSERECMRILRHEAGHALDNAFRLHARADWRKVFGPSSRAYPTSYKPNPASRKYVLHLDHWYAQAHPLEDYAETFAVWLKPGARWQQRYKGWPALTKLEYIQSLMAGLRGKSPQNRARSRVDPLSKLKITLREYYREKKALYSLEYPDFFDYDLLRVFSRDTKTNSPSAVSFLWKFRKDLCALVAEGTGIHAYTIDHVLDNIRERARELKLRLSESLDITRDRVIVLLAAHTMNVVHSGKYRFRYGI